MNSLLLSFDSVMNAVEMKYKADTVKCFEEEPQEDKVEKQDTWENLDYLKKIVIYLLHLNIYQICLFQRADVLARSSALNPPLQIYLN